MKHGGQAARRSNPGDPNGVHRGRCSHEGCTVIFPVAHYSKSSFVRIVGGFVSGGLHLPPPLASTSLLLQPPSVCCDRCLPLAHSLLLIPQRSSLTRLPHPPPPTLTLFPRPSSLDLLLVLVLQSSPFLPSSSSAEPSSLLIVMIYLSHSYPSHRQPSKAGGMEYVAKRRDGMQHDRCPSSVLRPRDPSEAFILPSGEVFVHRRAPMKAAMMMTPIQVGWCVRWLVAIVAVVAVVFVSYTGIPERVCLL
jgi:hypothetical protein